MNDWEKISLKQGLCVLEKYPFCLVAPYSMDVSSYMKYHNFRVERFSDSFFRSKKSYSELMLCSDIYNRFRNFDYMLVFQLDVFVFSDKLKEFCDKGYDYVGAPVPRVSPIWRDIGVSVGNGGFSLRRISSVLRVLEQKKEIFKLQPNWWNENYLQIWEDVFFAFCSTISILNFKIPKIQEALEFSVENDVRHIYKTMPEKLPFGCHAWWVTNYWHWKPIIEKFGYRLPAPKGVQLKNARLGYLERYVLTRMVRKANNDNCIDIMRRVLPENEYIIWGYGEYGKLVYKLLKKSGKNVLAIIDPNISNMKLCDKTRIIRTVDEFVGELTPSIIVASLKYEDEIIEDEISDKISQQSIIRITWLLDCIIKKYTKFLVGGH
jgi:hypothetical protein